MDINEMVCNLRQATKLKKLGLRQDTYFAWLENYDQPVLSGRYSENVVAAAYTSSELGKILGVWAAKVIPQLDGLYLLTEPCLHKTLYSSHKTEAEARAD